MRKEEVKAVFFEWDYKRHALDFPRRDSAQVPLRRAAAAFESFASARHAVDSRRGAGVSVCCSVVYFCITLYCVYTMSCEEELYEK
jgi:hypothetical protein